MRKRALSLGVLFFAIALVSAFPGSAAAQDQDPPGRVARLNYIQGSVSYQVSGDQDWVQADPNRPLTTGDNLWADKDSRGEVHIGSTAIRMSSETGISFLTLDDRTTQIQLAQGTIEVHLRILQSGDAFEVDTPNLALTLTQAGEYRIETDPNGGSTVIVVREGAGEVTGGGDTWGLGPRQQYTFNGTDQLTYDAGPAPAFDDFEDWCQSRDQRENDAVSAKYVSRDVDGYYDLDDYGSWQSDSDYGEIWVPSGVAVGWSPYQMGHWVFIEPWGWTWVDSEPWGWAPFHYGRWAYVGDRWGWVPGPIVVRPVYAPALVGFVGGGGFGFSVAFGGGFSGVGWFPARAARRFRAGISLQPALLSKCKCDEHADRERHGSKERLQHGRRQSRRDACELHVRKQPTRHHSRVARYIRERASREPRDRARQRGSDSRRSRSRHHRADRSGSHQLRLGDGSRFHSQAVVLLCAASRGCAAESGGRNAAPHTRIHKRQQAVQSAAKYTRERKWQHAAESARDEQSTCE